MPQFQILDLQQFKDTMTSLWPKIASCQWDYQMGEIKGDATPSNMTEAKMYKNEIREVVVNLKKEFSCYFEVKISPSKS